MKETIVMIFLFFNIGIAQEDTLKSFYPLSVGNYWQYKITYRGDNNPDSALFKGEYDYMQVLKDTVMGIQQKSYKSVKVVGRFTPTKYLRYDSLTSSIYAIYPNDDKKYCFIN